MSFSNTHAAIVKAYVDGSFLLPTSYPNKKYEPTTGTPWSRLTILRNQPEVATLGSSGDDEHTGIVRIDLNYPDDKGVGAIHTKADAIAATFKAGATFTYSGVTVRIESCGIGAGRNEDGWYKVPVLIEWYSYISRA